jgi:site-specific recombinase XerD
LAGYTGNTRVSYATDLHLFARWCADGGVRLLEVRRAHLESFASDMEQQGRMRSTVARRRSTLCSFYRYCHLEGLLERNAAVNVRRPKIDPQSRTLGLDPNELGALLVQAGLGSPRDTSVTTVKTIVNVAGTTSCSYSRRPASATTRRRRSPASTST